MRVEPRHTAGLNVVGARGTAATLTVRARAAARLAAPVTLAGTAAALALLAWTAIAPESAAGAAFVPLLVGMVFLGLPHGALDHLVPARMGVAWGRRPSTLALFLAGYVGLAGAFLWLWTAAPALAFGGFLVATVWHWGQGDVDFLERFLGRRRGGRIDHAAAVVLRGALPVAVPVLVQTEVAEGLFATAAVATGAVAVGGLGLGAPAVGWGLGGALLALAGVYLAGLGRAWRGWPGRALDVGELLLLVALFAWVPAYLAIGTYFIAWHSLRHLARLLLLRDVDARALATGDLRGPVVRLSRDLAPITLLALAFLAALTAWSGPRVGGVEGFVALYLVWISALTMPHLVLVAWMDVGQGRPGAGEQP
jgi:beta-carotene 15,15'-dioxygenase